MTILLALVIAIIFAIAIHGLLKVNYQLREEYEKKILNLNKDLQKEIQLAREDSLKRSRSTMRGQATEHLAPLLMNSFNAKDFRFMGNPIDYLVCQNVSEHIDGDDTNPINVFLVDIKTGKSSLSKVQRKIRDAIVQGRVFFATFNPDTNEFLKWGVTQLNELPKEDNGDQSNGQLSA